MVGFEGYTM